MRPGTVTTKAPPPAPDLSGLRADQDPSSEAFRVPASRPMVYLRAAKWYLDLLKSDWLAPRINRDRAHVSGEYEAGWTPDNTDYAAHTDANRAVFLVQGKPVFVNGWFIVKRYTDLILAAIDRLGATSVLEVGAGRGKNLALFALRRPDLELSGLELTSTGVANSLSLVDDLPPQFLQVAGASLTPAEAKERLRRIRFHRGDAMDMPFADKSFDVSFTSLVLEQMPRDYPRVLQQMRRVTRKFCIFNEAFSEANGWRGRTHLKRVDYFRASVEEFARHGLEPIYFTTALPQKLTFRSGFLVARVMD
jgi:SAM-dependent methyltransferase